MEKIKLKENALLEGTIFEAMHIATIYLSEHIFVYFSLK